MSKAKKVKKPVNLSTAKVADGALKAPTSVWEVVGRRAPTGYDTTDFDKYQRMLTGMSLYELQDHAQKIGVLPSIDRKVTLDRLEERFKRENGRQSVPNVPAQAEASAEIKAQAIAIMNRSR